MQRPSIVFINRVYPPVRGASGRVLRELARSMARNDWQVTVITTGPKALTERDGAVRVIRVKAPERPVSAFSYILIWLKLFVAAMRLPATDVVATMTDPPFTLIIGRFVSLIKKNKHVHWCQDLYPDVFPALGVNLPGFVFKLLKGMSRKALLKADKIFVIGRCMAGRLTHDGIPAKNITVVPNWPDKELIAPQGAGGFNDRSSKPMQVSDDNFYRAHEDQVKHGPKFRVLYAGNLGRAHPVDAIIKAAEILNEEHPEIEFIFVGDGPRYDRLARERARLHLDNIKLLPYQPASRLRDLMESGDVHLISMRERAAGMIVPVKLYSAIAAHRPCIFIGPQPSETAKVIEDFKLGSVLPQRDPQALADVIRQYRMDSAVWFAAHEGAKRAAQVFLPEQSIQTWMSRVSALLEAKLK